MAYELIETVEVGAGGASSIEFTSIPQDGTDLVVVASLRSDRTSTDGLRMRFNSDSGSNYTYIVLRGTPSDVRNYGFTSTGIGSNNSVPGSAETSNTFSNHGFYISNYTSSSDKSVSVDAVSENNATEAYQVLTGGSYSTTSAISSIALLTFNVADFVQYTTASLYKITAA